MSTIEIARTIADAVLYEGYLLYPYRATSGKNLLRWQFGVLGPRGAEAAGLGEDSHLAMMSLLRSGPAEDGASLTVHVRCLQVQRRQPQRADAAGGFTDVAELVVDGQSSYCWDEAVEIETTETVPLAELAAGRSFPVLAPAGEDVEEVRDHTGAVVGRLVRQRRRTSATAYVQTVRVGAEPVTQRLTLTLDHDADATGLDRDEVLRHSLMGTHVIIEAEHARFVSVIDPPPDATEAAAACRQHRCWPVLVGAPGEDSLLLGSPIILYDHPEIASQSTGSLFDSTEIDEILTLRVMTMTEQEKAEARATDPKAAEIIDRCDAMSPADLQQLHGVLRNPHAVGPSDGEPPTAQDWFDTGDQPWWDPATDERVRPEEDAVVIDGVSVSKGSLVRVHPSRRADAQDLFFADQVARVTQVLSDVDGQVHVALVLVDDPAADLHEWYGRYLYFAPDELEPLPPLPPATGKEN